MTGQYRIEESWEPECAKFTMIAMIEVMNPSPVFIFCDWVLKRVIFYCHFIINIFEALSQFVAMDTYITATDGWFTIICRKLKCQCFWVGCVGAELGYFTIYYVSLYVEQACQRAHKCSQGIIVLEWKSTCRPLKNELYIYTC